MWYLIVLIPDLCTITYFKSLCEYGDCFVPITLKIPVCFVASFGIFNDFLFSLFFFFSVLFLYLLAFFYIEIYSETDLWNIQSTSVYTVKSFCVE